MPALRLSRAVRRGHPRAVGYEPARSGARRGEAPIHRAQPPMLLAVVILILASGLVSGLVLTG
jgi:hypothetical protein